MTKPGSASALLAHIASGCDGVIETRALPTKARAFAPVDAIADLAPFVRAHAAENVYFGAATRRDDTSGTAANLQHLGTLFVDLDAKQAGDVDAALARIPLPASAIVRTGGGLHGYWFLREPLDVSTPEDVAAAKRLLRRLALACGGDLAAAEPARVLRLPGTLNIKYDPHAKVIVERLDAEARYNVIDFDEWMPVDAPEGAPAPAGAPFTVPTTIGNGSRNHTLYTLGRSLKAKHVAPAAIGHAIRATNDQQCEPPLPAGEVEAVIRQVMTQADRRDFQATAAPVTRTTTTVRLLDDVELMTLSDPAYGIEKLLPDRGVSVVYGPSGACKTTFVAGTAGSTATGRALYGHRVLRPGPVVYVACEDASGFKQRLRAWKVAHGFDLDQVIGVYTWPEPLQLLDLAQVSQFQEVVRTIRPVSIWIDTYAAATPGSTETSSEDVTLAMTHARQWADELDAHVGLVHHTNASGSRERGHSSMRGAADAMLQLTPTDDEIELLVDKQRNGPRGYTVKLTLAPVAGAPGCVLVPALDDAPGSRELTEAQQRCLDVLRDTFGRDGATKTEWLRVMSGMSERTFYRASAELGEKGYLQQVGQRFTTSGSRR